MKIQKTLWCWWPLKRISSLWKVSMEFLTPGTALLSEHLSNPLAMPWLPTQNIWSVIISSHIVTRHHTQKHTCLMSAAVDPALAQFPGTFVKRTRQPAWHTAVATGLVFRDNFLAAKPTISLLKVSFFSLFTSSSQLTHLAAAFWSHFMPVCDLHSLAD